MGDDISTRTTNFQDAVQRVAEQEDFGAASARKRGRNPDYPYVPVIERVDPSGMYRTANPLKGRAYATRAEAVAAAQRQIDAQRENLARQLAEPRYRALRELYGLPREVW